MTATSDRWLHAAGNVDDQRLAVRSHIGAALWATEVLVLTADRTPEGQARWTDPMAGWDAEPRTGPWVLVRHIDDWAQAQRTGQGTVGVHPQIVVADQLTDEQLGQRLTAQLLEMTDRSGPYLWLRVLA